MGILAPMRNLLWWVGGPLLVAAFPVWVAAVPSGSAADYAILGISSVLLGGGVDVQGGDVGANGKSGSVRMRGRAQVEGTVAADTIQVGRSAHAGALFCAKLDRLSSTAQACEAAPPTLPLVAVLPTVQADPGTERIDLGRSDVQNGLAAGRYGMVRIGARAHLGLAGGEYDFRFVKIGRRGELVCEGTAAPTCLIRVKDRMAVGERGVISANAPLDARAIRIEIAGHGPIVAFGAVQKAQIAANIYAPNGHIFLGGGGRYEGAFIADSVEVLTRARIITATAF